MKCKLGESLAPKSSLFLLFCLLLFVRTGAGQERNPLPLDAVKLSLSTKEFQVAEILRAIDDFGIDFKLDEASLTPLLDAAKAAERSSGDVSAVLWHLVKACRTCRDMFWAPLSAKDLPDWVKRSPAAALEELKLRGSETLPLSAAFVDELKKAGASPELIAVVEDRLQIPAPDGYKTVRLDRTPEFSPLASAGKLVIKVEIDEDAEFYFRHNVLFWKKTKGADPKFLGCTYTAFGPVASAPGGWSLDPPVPKGKKPRKGKEPVSSKNEVSDSDGRPGLVVSVTDVETGPHEYELVLNWKR